MTWNYSHQVVDAFTHKFSFIHVDLNTAHSTLKMFSTSSAELVIRRVFWGTEGLKSRQLSSTNALLQSRHTWIVCRWKKLYWLKVFYIMILKCIHLLFCLVLSLLTCWTLLYNAASSGNEITIAGLTMYSRTTSSSSWHHRVPTATICRAHVIRSSVHTTFW